MNLQYLEKQISAAIGLSGSVKPEKQAQEVMRVLEQYEIKPREVRDGQELLRCNSHKHSVEYTQG